MPLKAMRLLSAGETECRGHYMDGAEDSEVLFDQVQDGFVACRAAD